MPKATLTFQLPDEREDFDLACKAGALHSALWDLSQELRSRDKYSEDPATTWAEVRQLFWDVLRDAGVDLA